MWKASSCSKPPDSWERRIDVDPRDGTWTDPRYGQGLWCYRVEIVNRYGAGRPPDVRAVERWAPVPDAPAVGTPVWLPVERSFRISWTPPDDNTHLEVVRSSGDPGTCPSSYDDGYADWLSEDGQGRWLVPAYDARTCVLFVAVSSWGAVSPPVQVVLQVPPPTVTPTVGSLTYDPDTGSATVSASLAGDEYELRVEVVPGACPSQPPEDVEWWDGYEARTGCGPSTPSRTVRSACSSPLLTGSVSTGLSSPGPSARREPASGG